MIFQHLEMYSGLKLYALMAFLLLPLSQAKTITKYFGPFNDSHRDDLLFSYPATIHYEALQVTPDSINGGFNLRNYSGRVLLNHQFKLWEGDSNSSNSSSISLSKVASFNTSFLINLYRTNVSTPGEGLTFLIAPDHEKPPESHGQFLGLTNSTTDGNTTNHIIAIEFDTFKQSFDPDDNHIGLDINSVRSSQTKSLSELGFELSSNETNYMVWIEYDGAKKFLRVYMVNENSKTPTKTRPDSPIMTADLDISKFVKQKSYFGFSASTGNTFQLNCVLRWNLTVEDLSDEDDSMKMKIALGVGVPIAALLVAALGATIFFLRKKRFAANDPNIVGALRHLPGAPREFGLRELKKATNNFDEKQKLGQGGFGVVYKGVLNEEDMQIAVKRFSRDNIKSKDDFLAELTVINLLRHKNLVRLLGWCHKDGMLLLVYEYMPNGGLDTHLYCNVEKETLGWNLRFNIISGVASALHYLHYDYNQKVLHRDLKSSNILLDSHFNARLGDFGLARAIDSEKTSYAERSGVPGTMGYIAPECLHTGRATRESDVYGFGAVVLEVVCGHRPMTQIGGYNCLVDWVWSLHREGRILEAVDERLKNDYVAEEAERMLLLGLACSHPSAGERPNTQSIVQIIAGLAEMPFIPPFRPPFVWPSSGPTDEDETTDTDHISISIQTADVR